MSVHAPTRVGGSVRPAPKWFRWVLDRAWWVLSGWALLFAAIHIPVHGWSWHYIVTGVHALFSSAPLSLYAGHPELQMGPLTFVIAAPFVLAFHGVLGEVGAMVIMVAIGVALVREIRLIAFGPDAPADVRWFMTSLVVLAVWPELAVHWGHVDDAFAILAGVVGLRLIRQNRQFAAAIAFGLAVDFKPWTLPFAVLLLLAPKRTWAGAVTLCAAVVCAGWLPFILGDPHTLSALQFGIHVDGASTLHLLDRDASTTPDWVRAAQAAVAIVLGVIAVWRKRWASVIVLVIAVRLLLDPATKNYYDSGLIVATALFDVVAVLGTAPLLTIAAVVLVYLPSYVVDSEPGIRGVLRTIGLLAIVVIASVIRARARPEFQAPRSGDPVRNLVMTT